MCLQGCHSLLYDSLSWMPRYLAECSSQARLWAPSDEQQKGWSCTPSLPSTVGLIQPAQVLGETKGQRRKPVTLCWLTPAAAPLSTSRPHTVALLTPGPSTSERATAKLFEVISLWTVGSLSWTSRLPELSCRFPIVHKELNPEWLLGFQPHGCLNPLHIMVQYLFRTHVFPFPM